MTDQELPELYTCFRCEENKPENEMYETGWNHDPLCYDCEDLFRIEERRTGKRYVWVGDKRYLVKS